MMKIAVIGAGITGLTVAQKLKSRADVTVFDKARGVGGRTATRRADPYSFDHGAQYFVVKTEAFRSFLEPALSEGVIKRWDARFAEIDAAGSATHISNTKVWSEDYPHFVGVPGMNAFAKFLARDLNVKTATRIGELVKTTHSDRVWELFDDQNTTCGVYDWVIVTTPPEQAVELLPKSFSNFDDVSKIDLLPCFSLMLGFDQDISLPFDAALVRNSPISWVAKNSSKPGRPDFCSLLIQSTNDWAKDHVDDYQEEVQKFLTDECSRLLDMDLSHCNHRAVHRWLYANTVKHRKNNGEPFIDVENQIGAAGDWCGNARVESAFLHGDRLAKSLLNRL